MESQLQGLDHASDQREVKARLETEIGPERVPYHSAVSDSEAQTRRHQSESRFQATIRHPRTITRRGE